MAVVLVFWTMVALGLTLSRYVDSQRGGGAVTLFRAMALMMPLMLPQICFSLGVAWLLHRQRQWLDRPLHLLVGAAATVPIYLLLATPAVVALSLWTAGRPWAAFGASLSAWAAINVWVDAMVASAGLALQIGWAFWRHAQEQRENALRANAENLELRLVLLRGQLEPHFLFNTLNSIAALVRGAERGVALQALSRLSELLRYTLRASQQRWVSMADELRFVEDYVALQRLRFGDSLHWEARIDGSDWVHWASPPLLLQPLVENAVRYGLEAAEPGQAAELLLQLQCEGQYAVMSLSNPRGEAASLMSGHGLGLAKTRERLQVLYGERARIDTEMTPQRFELRLYLPLEALDAALEAASEDEHA